MDEISENIEDHEKEIDSVSPSVETELFDYCIDIMNNIDDKNYDSWKKILNSNLDEEQQNVLAELADLWNKIDYIDIQTRRDKCIWLLRVAAINTICGKNINLSIKLKDQIKQIVDNYYKQNRNPIIKAIRSFIFDPSNRILIGLFSFLYLAIPLFIIFLTSFSTFVDKIIPSQYFINAIVLGSIGSISSIMLRYDSMNIKGVHPDHLFFTGFFKPIIGGIFAIVLFAIYKSGILPIKIGEQQDAEKYFLLSLFFLAGFSERFFTDMLSKVEKITVGETQNK